MANLDRPLPSTLLRGAARIDLSTIYTCKSAYFHQVIDTKRLTTTHYVCCATPSPESIKFVESEDATRGGRFFSVTLLIYSLPPVKILTYF